MTQSNIFVYNEKYVALWHIYETKVPRDQLPKVKPIKNKKNNAIFMIAFVGCSINYHKLKVPGSLRAICKTFLNLVFEQFLPNIFVF